MRRTDLKTEREKGMATDQCAVCGCAGTHCDTSAGELTNVGEVVAKGAGEILMAGLADGTRLDELFCDRCARERPLESEPKAKSNADL